MVTIGKRFEIDAGHRLMNHGGKCKNLHGHRYGFEVTIGGPLDEVGRVLDFGEIKDKLGSWLDEHWDHATIVQVEDTQLVNWLVWNQQKHYLLPSPPSAENLAIYFRQLADNMLRPMGVRVIKVRCYETPTCWADSEAGG